MADDADSAAPVTEPAQQKVWTRAVRMAAFFGIVAMFAVGALAVSLGMQARHNEDESARTALFMDTARQSAVDLTTIDSGHIDEAVARILDSSTGAFHEDFKNRAGAFASVVKESQASSQGTVTEIGVEHENGSGAQILVAVAVKTTTAGVPEQQPRLWRMRLTYEQVDATPKLSDVVFVP